MLGTVPLIMGGLLIAMLPWVSGAGAKIAILVIGTGLTGPIYVVCAPMISEFTPIAQRGAVIAIFGAIYTLAGVIAPFANQTSVIEGAATALDGYPRPAPPHLRGNAGRGRDLWIAANVAGGGPRPHHELPDRERG